jgi:hypothetical protein
MRTPARSAPATVTRAAGCSLCWRDRAIGRVICGDADERIVCSLTIWKVFVLTLSFQAKVFL